MLESNEIEAMVVLNEKDVVPKELPFVKGKNSPLSNTPVYAVADELIAIPT